MGNRLEIITILFTSVLFVNSSIEIERQSRFQFFNLKAYQDLKNNEFTILKEKQKFELELSNKQHELEIIDLTAKV